MTSSQIPCDPPNGAVRAVPARFSSSNWAQDDALTTRTRTVWSAGDFGRIAEGYARGAATFIERLAIRKNELVLDVATGSGNLALPAARAGGQVYGIDIAPNLVKQARANALAEGFDIAFDEGNAEALPYPDETFDTVVSMFGVMFAARPECVVSELVRVTRPGGRIVLASWTPSGFIGQMFKTVTAYVPPPKDVPSVLQWGDAAKVRDRFAAFDERISSHRATPRLITLAYPLSPAGTVELFRGFYGPTVKAFENLDAERRAGLSRDLVKLWTDANQATDGTTSVDGEYLEVELVL